VINPTEQHSPPQNPTHTLHKKKIGRPEIRTTERAIPPGAKRDEPVHFNAQVGVVSNALFLRPAKKKKRNLGRKSDEGIRIQT